MTKNFKLSLVFLLTAMMTLVAGFGQNAPLWAEDSPKNFVAVAFTGEDYTGVSWAIPAVGDYDLWAGFALPNDSISSIRVRPGYQVTLYEHSEFGGKSTTVKSDSPKLNEFKHWASSLKVEADKDQADDPEWMKNALVTGEVKKLPEAAGEQHNQELIKEFRYMFEPHWYGGGTDGERVEKATALLAIFKSLGCDVSEWTPHTFAQQINNFLDWRKNKSVWATACQILNIEPQGPTNPDAEVKGLWLTCPDFPEEAQVITFSADQDLDMILYERLYEAVVQFEIRRQLIEESELQNPGDVAGLIEMRVYNDEIDDKEIEANMKTISVKTDVDEFSELYTHPCAMAEYTTGANEDTRQNRSLFIFTDLYCFEVMISVGADLAADYEGMINSWFHSLKFVEK